MTDMDYIATNRVAACDHISYGYAKVGIQSGMGLHKDVCLLTCKGCGTTLSTKTIRKLLMLKSA